MLQPVLEIRLGKIELITDIPFMDLFRKHPSEVIVRGFIIKINADDCAHVLPGLLLGKPGILHGIPGGFKHEQVLGNDVWNFRGRYVEIFEIPIK